MESELTDVEYLIAFSDSRTALADACVRQALECGRLYCERTEDAYKGFLCTVIEGRTESILYAYTKPEYRGMGVFTSLAEHVVKTAERDVCVSLPEDHPYFAAINAVCKRLGLRPTEELHTFSFDRTQEAAWRRTKKTQRFTACCDLLRRAGCETVFLADASEDILRQIRESHISEFRNPIDPSSFFLLKSKNLSLELSCAAVKEGRVLAYSLLSQQSADTVIFEQIATSADTRDLGVIMLPYVCSTDRFFDRGYTHCTFVIYPSNTASNRIRRTLEKDFVLTEKTTRQYRCIKEPT